MAEGTNEAQVVTETPVVEESTRVYEAGPNEPGFGEVSPATMQRPEWVPEKFFRDGVINYKDLAQSYVELEKLKSAPKVEETPATEEAVTEETPVAPAIPVGSVPGITADRTAHFTKEITEQGTLSVDSYGELEKLGYSKAVVDIYIQGLMKDVTVTSAVEEARLADAEIASVKASIGGEAVLKDMLQWAKVNLSDTDKKVYDKAVASGDAAQMRMAVTSLHNRFVKQQGQAPNYVDVGGNSLPGVQGLVPYASDQEAVADMSTPAYRNDPGYRLKVQQRLKVSDVFGDARDLTKVR